MLPCYWYLTTQETNRISCAHRKTAESTRTHILTHAIEEIEIEIEMHRHYFYKRLVHITSHLACVHAFCVNMWWIGFYSSKLETHIFVRLFWFRFSWIFRRNFSKGKIKQQRIAKAEDLEINLVNRIANIFWMRSHHWLCCLFEILHAQRLRFRTWQQRNRREKKWCLIWCQQWLYNRHVNNQMSTIEWN